MNMREEAISSSYILSVFQNKTLYVITQKMYLNVLKKPSSNDFLPYGASLHCNSSPGNMLLSFGGG